MSDPNGNNTLILNLNTILQAAYKAEEEFWKQRSRQLWLTLGDRNSGYFHAITKGRKAVNKFSVLESEAGTIIHEEADIVQTISNYFQKLFSSTPAAKEEIIHKAISPCISAETNAQLTVTPTAQEIRQALFSIHRDKAPGPDGFSACFFQSNWDVVGPSIVTEIQQFFITGQLPSDINHTHVRLIPKIASPKLVSDYRPIALCNVYYKIISKILTIRLKPILPSIISDNQSAFVRDRAIEDNVLITHEVLHFLKSSKAKKFCSMAVKTDMSKAYDRVEWDFIRLVLLRLGFSSIWVNWIMQCITTVTYSFLINGAAQGFIQPQRGIRQGDPLSPFIFILCGEVLSGMCNQAQANGTLIGIRVARKSPQVNHLLFADDTMFFIKSNAQCCDALMTIVHSYEIASGQIINPLKSSITFSSKTPPSTKERVKRTLGITKEGGLGKYLGLPEHFGRRKKDLFSLIIDRIRQKAVHWSSKFLSTAGKMTLIKAVLSVIPTYTMSCLKIPVSLCKRIQSAITRFWWDASMEKRKMCWVSWDHLTKSKKDGGLGFRDISSFNDALLAKLSWRILQHPNSLVARVLNGKYCHTLPFLKAIPPTSASHGWKSIMLGRDLITSKIGHVIGNGKATKVWEDSWLSLDEPITPYGPATFAAKDLVVADLIDETTATWKKDLVSTILPHHLHQILALRPSMYGGEDKTIWLPTTDGIYTTRSGYHTSKAETSIITRGTCPTSELDWQKSVWQGPFSPKLQLFAWKLLNGAIPTGENLAKRGLLNHITCLRCGELETTTHLLFRCPFATEEWNLIPFLHLHWIPQLQNFQEGITKIHKTTCLPPVGTHASTLFMWVCWNIWIARNKLIFETRSSSPQDTATTSIAEAREWTIAQEAEHHFRTAPPTIPSTTSQNISHQFICFTDAAWRASDQAAGFGWIFRNREESWTQSGSQSEVYVASPFLAEALAVRKAMMEALELGITDMHLHSDAKELVLIINGKKQSKQAFGVLQDILILSASFLSISFSHVSRSANCLADALAKDALLLASLVLVSSVFTPQP